jgi:ankyrin repeat domain-containing protein 50
MPNQRAMLDAAFWGHRETVRELLEQEPALARAASAGEHYEAGVTALHLAACGGHLEVACFLIAAGADVNAVVKDGTPLSIAVWEGHLELVEFLLVHGANPRATAPNGETALHLAAYKGNVAAGRLLIARGALVNCRTTTGTTDIFITSPPVCGESPLHLAAAYGHREFVELLLAHGADCRIRDHTGQTPANWAARHHQNELVRLLS